MKEILLNFKEPSVPISIGQDLIFSLNFINFCKTLSSKFVIITDDTVKGLYAEKLSHFFLDHQMDSFIISIPPGEKSKTRETKALIEDEMLQKKIKKDALIIALGGGMVLDIAAFVAATYLRGIPFIMIPTTLLAMVDASMGGKAAINTLYGKNLIGTYCHPKKIFMDLLFLKTLSEKEKRNGFAEVIKYGIISDKALFDALYEKEPQELEEIIYSSCLIKKNIVERDEKENSIRAVLNFGHSVGHSLESLENYEISHGEAIALGMIFAGYLSIKMNNMAREDFFKIFTIFKKYHFPLVFSQRISRSDILEKLSFDKKSNGKGFVLIEKIGSFKDDNYLQLVDDKLLHKALIWFCKRFASKAEKWK